MFIKKTRKIIQETADTLRVVPMVSWVVLEAIVGYATDSIKNKRAVNKIIAELPKSLTKEEKAILLTDIDRVLYTFAKTNIFYHAENVSLYYRIDKMKGSVIKENVSEIDIQLIKFLYKKEKLENIAYKSNGRVHFQLEEPYLSMVKKRVKDHFFMEKWCSLSSDTQLVIENWAREKEDLIDLLLFIQLYGRIESVNFFFSHADFGFDAIQIKEGILCGYLKNTYVGELSNENGFLMNTNIDIEDKRRVISADLLLPCIPEYMKQREKNEQKKIVSKKEVILENGEQVSVCSQCVFRTRQLTQNGCVSCEPKNI